MAIIYTYPVKKFPTTKDLLLISDVDDGKKTKNITISEFNRVVSGVIEVNNRSGSLTITGGSGIQVDTVNSDIKIINTQPPYTPPATGIVGRIPIWTSTSALGNSSFKQSSFGGGVFQIGTQESVYIGDETNVQTTATVPQHNVGVGDESLKSFTGGLDINTGDEIAGDNVAVGYKALTSLDIGTNNIGIGVESLLSLNSGSNNIAIGKKSLGQLFSFTGNNKSNIALGFDTLGDLITGEGNVSIGQSTFDKITTANNSTALGHRSGKNFTGDIDDSVVLGYNVLIGSTATSANSAVLIGRNAGQQTSGTLNDDIFIGLNSGGTSTSAGSNIAIGSRANIGVGAGSRTGSIAIGTTGGTNTGSGGTANSYATVIGSYDFADVGLGSRNSSTGKYSAILGGLGNTNNADYGIIVGGRSNTIQVGALNGSILGGFNNLIESTSGSAGFAIGSNITVAGQNQLVVGRYNISNNNTKFIVGTGSGNAALKNGFEVLNTGQIRFPDYGFTQSGSNIPFPQNIANNWSLCSISRNDGKLTQVTQAEVSSLKKFINSESVNITTNGGFVQLTNQVEDLVLATTSASGFLATVRISTTTPLNRVFTVLNNNPASYSGTTFVNLSGVTFATLTAGQSATFFVAPGPTIKVIATNF